MKIKVKKLVPEAVVPFKKHNTDFCLDVVATSLEIKENGVYCYGTGLAFQIDRQSVTYPLNNSFDSLLSIDVRPRSSIYKTGLVLCNSTGTCDESYVGEVKLMFYKVADGEPYKVGDRIAQIKVGISVPIEFEEVKELSSTDRGDGGFGSTGK